MNTTQVTISKKTRDTEIKRARQSLALQERILASQQEGREILKGVSLEVIDIEDIISRTEELINFLTARIHALERRYRHAN